MADIAAGALFGAYRLLGRAALPILPLALSLRAARGKEDRSRLGERFGRPSRPRPPGRLIWVHAASVGETNAVLPLVGRLIATGATVLLTSVTVTSAKVAATGLPAGAVHQYGPVDIGPVIDRFLGHWRPDLALFVESEQWPTTIARLADARVPRVIVNGRMSDGSYRRWSRLGSLVRPMFARTALCLAQSARDAGRYAALGAGNVSVSGNLKFDVPPPAAAAADIAALGAAIGARPVWLAASTHDGEESIAADVHTSLRSRHPGLLTIVAPRHPDRGPAIEAALSARGLAVSRRSAGGAIDPALDIYLADTLGELGLFYRLAPVAFLGGSLVRRGGQNPIEPARLDAVVLHGPQVYNFTDIYEALDRSGQAELVRDPRELANAVAALIGDPDAVRRRVSRAGATLAPFTGALDATMLALAPFLARSSREVATS